MFKRIYSLFMARNKEFVRDREGFGWNLLFPFMMVLCFFFVFNNNNETLYKGGYILANSAKTQEKNQSSEFLKHLKNIKHIELILFKDEQLAIKKLRHHRLDFLIKIDNKKVNYWTNESSPKSYIAEKILLGSNKDILKTFPFLQKNAISGTKITYLDWVFPGILAMNMMFSALFGIGYVIVRYRKEGVLKRFKATPLTAFEYLVSQIISRICVLVSSAIIVYFGCNLFYKFQILGSPWLLLATFALGGFCLASMGLIISARTSSEELANGILNLITLPMMLLSETWFSLEGSNKYILYLSELLPLTHINHALRKIMNEGAGLAEISHHLIFLGISTAIFLAIGSYFFKWTKD